MKQQFEDYITRSREIRSLSMPPEETEAHIGEIYRLFNENFARALANTRTLEMVDVQLAWLILRDLYYYYKKQYEEKSTIVQQHIMEAIGEIKAIERESAKKVEEWQSNVALLTVNTHINYIKSKYKRNKKINHFLDSIKKDILKNISCFVDDGKVKQQPNVPQPKPEIGRASCRERV